MSTVSKNEWKVKLGCRSWTVKLARFKTDLGRCDAEKREIKINRKLLKDETLFLATLIHEARHAQAWYLDEDVVDEEAVELAELVESVPDHISFH